MGLLQRRGKTALGLEQFNMTGYLKKRNTKQSSVLMKNWDKRWFALDDTALLYAASPKEKCPKQAFPVADILDVRLVDAEADSEGKGVYEFEVTLPGRTLRLRPKSESQRRHWVMALEKVRAALKENNPKEINGAAEEDVAYKHAQYHGERAVREQKRPPNPARSAPPRPQEERYSNSRSHHNDAIPTDEDWNTWDDDDLYISEDDMPETVPKRKHIKAQPEKAVSAQRQSRYRSKAQKVVEEDWDGAVPSLRQQHESRAIPTKVYNNVLCTSTDEEEEDVKQGLEGPPPVQAVSGIEADANWLNDDWDSSDEEE